MSWASRTVITLRDCSRPKSQRRGAKEFAAVIFWLPDATTLPHVDFYWRIHDDGRGRVAVIKRRGVDDGLKRRTRLSQRLRGAVKLALVEREAADHGEHAAGVWVHHHHGAGNLRNLAQPVLALLIGQRIDIDDVAGRQHLADIGNGFRRSGRRLCPLHAVNRHDAGRAILDHVAARVARRLQADARRLIGDFEHHGHVPRIDIRQ